jgi:hypothetical protein
LLDVESIGAGAVYSAPAHSPPNGAGTHVEDKSKAAMRSSI